MSAKKTAKKVAKETKIKRTPLEKLEKQSEKIKEQIKEQPVLDKNFDFTTQGSPADCCNEKPAAPNLFYQGYEAGRKDTIDSNELLFFEKRIREDSDELKNVCQSLKAYNQEISLMEARKAFLKNRININSEKLKSRLPECMQKTEEAAVINFAHL